MPSGFYTRTEEHKEKLRKQGFQKGLIGWNKGKKLKSLSLEHKKKIGNKSAGEGNHFYKDGRTLVKAYCKDCGKPLVNFRSIYCRRCTEKGERGHNWQGGIGFEPYPSDFNQQLKDRIRVRDNFICQKCGVPELECDRRLDIHHIDYDKENCREDNLLSLCHKCNTNVNANREYWTNYFQQQRNNNKKEKDHGNKRNL